MITSLLLLLASSIVFAQEHPDGFKISTDVELVLLDVSVKGWQGNYRSGLGRDSFRVYENGEPQTISEFASGDVPVVAGLVMDDSGSMRSKRPETILAGLAFIEASNPQDQIFVVNFNENARRGLPTSVPFSDDINLLRSALAIGRPEGRTALYDAIALALKHLESGRHDRKALVVVSDGGDNISEHTFKEVATLIQESRATIYTVGIFDADDSDRNPDVLKHIADLSGGERFLPNSLDQIVPICQKIAKDIRNRYTIGYVPVRRDNKSALRKIRVVTVAPDGEKLIVRTRASYVMPNRVTK
jgi:Ca-activated chloride channel family protein